MKRTPKALTEAYKILKWLHKRGMYCDLSAHDFQGEAQPKFIVQVNGDSFKDVHAIKKEFTFLGKFSRKQWVDNEPKLEYNCKVIFDDSILTVRFYAVEELPPHCKIVTKQILVPEEIMSPVIAEHYITEVKVVCN